MHHFGPVLKARAALYRRRCFVWDLCVGRGSLIPLFADVLRTASYLNMSRRLACANVDLIQMIFVNDIQRVLYKEP